MTDRMARQSAVTRDESMLKYGSVSFG
jgi:hypothetical protein